MDEQIPSTLFKILVLGDSTVGKTSLTLQFTKSKFVHSHILTIGVDVQDKVVQLHGEQLRLQIVREM
jgi:GTPase SAR1 family protein